MAVIQPLPPAPSTSDPANFNGKADAMLGALPNFVTQANQLEVNLTASAAPGGVMVPLIFDGSSTADADPGNGKFRIGGATQNTATVWRVDLLSALGLDVTALWAWMSTASTSATKGQARIQKSGDPTKYIVADVTAVASPTGYRNITVSPIVASSANPFTDLDACILTFAPTGGLGATGANGPWTNILSPASSLSGQTVVSFTGIPSGYADLCFHGAVTFASATDNINLQFYDGTSWSSPIAATSSSVQNYTFDLTIFDYLGDRSAFLFGYYDSLISSSPSAGRASQYAGPLRVTGGVKGVRFSANSGGAFSSGSIYPRAR